MTQKETNDFFGVTPSTYKYWKNDPTNKKHNLGLLIGALSVEEAKKIIERGNIKIKKKNS